MKKPAKIYIGICELIGEKSGIKELGCKGDIDDSSGAIVGLSTLIHFCSNDEIDTLFNKLRLKRAWAGSRPGILQVVKDELNSDVKHDRFYSVNGPFLKDRCDWRCAVSIPEEIFQIITIEYDLYWQGSMPRILEYNEICKVSFKQIREVKNLKKDFIDGIFENYNVLNKLENL